MLSCFFFFQAEDGIRDLTVTGVQTCALPIYEIRGRAHSNKVRQGNHRDGRKTAELDLRLAELRGFRSEDKIARRGQFHAATKTVTVDGGDFQAIRGGESAENTMKRGEHFPDALRRMI